MYILTIKKNNNEDYGDTFDLKFSVVEEMTMFIKNFFEHNLEENAIMEVKKIKAWSIENE